MTGGRRSDSSHRSIGSGYFTRIATSPCGSLCQSNVVVRYHCVRSSCRSAPTHSHDPAPGNCGPRATVGIAESVDKQAIARGTLTIEDRKDPKGAQDEHRDTQAENSLRSVEYRGLAPTGVQTLWRITLPGGACPPFSTYPQLPFSTFHCRTAEPDKAGQSLPRYQYQVKPGGVCPRNFRILNKIEKKFLSAMHRNLRRSASTGGAVLSPGAAPRRRIPSTCCYSAATN